MLSPKVLAVMFALATLFLDLTGYVWHGLLAQPSALYRGGKQSALIIP